MIGEMRAATRCVQEPTGPFRRCEAAERHAIFDRYPSGTPSCRWSAGDCRMSLAELADPPRRSRIMPGGDLLIVNYSRGVSSTRRWSFCDRRAPQRLFRNESSMNA